MQIQSQFSKLILLRRPQYTLVASLIRGMIRKRALVSSVPLVPFLFTFKILSVILAQFFLVEVKGSAKSSMPSFSFSVRTKLARLAHPIEEGTLRENIQRKKILLTSGTRCSQKMTQKIKTYLLLKKKRVLLIEMTRQTTTKAK